MKYALEIGRGGQDWETVSTDLEPDDLEGFIAAAFETELYDGKYNARVINSDGDVMCEISKPYEGVRINIRALDDSQLEKIREDYGIPTLVFHAMARAWVREFETKTDPLWYLKTVK